MKYRVLIESKAKKQISKLDPFASNRIKNWINFNLSGCTDPYIYGKALKGNLGKYWRYKVGDYRILAKIDDEKIIIAIVQVGHRKNIYN